MAKSVRIACNLIVIYVLTGCHADQNEIPGRNPFIYREYTESGLDSAYNQSFWAPNLQDVITQLDALQMLAQSAIGEPKRIQYGQTNAEILDLYRSDRERAPIHIHIHGGAWRGGNGAGVKAYNARKFVERGALYIGPDYTLVTDAEGSLYPMVEQLRQVVVWTYQHAVEYGGDPDRIFLSGHSAGGHLGGVLISTDWTEFGLPADVIKGALLSSGMYDLLPVSLSSRNEYVTFTEEMISDLSPIHHLNNITTPLILVFGSGESPEFIRQSEDFTTALIEQSKVVELFKMEGVNHFEMMVALGNPFSLPGQLMLEQMGLK